MYELQCSVPGEQGRGVQLWPPIRHEGKQRRLRECQQSQKTAPFY